MTRDRRLLLDWFLPMEQCCTLDEVSDQWNRLLAAHHVTAGYEDPRHVGAVLSFLARSTLPARLKLGAFLLHVPSLDVDPRLAFGALEPELDACWAAPLDSDVCMLGLPLDAQSREPWRLGYLQGRLMEVWHALSADRGNLDGWRRSFWQSFWVLCCDCADLEGVRLALAHGAGADPRDCAGIAAAAQGASTRTTDAWQAEGRTDADYIEVVGHLLDAQTCTALTGGSALAAAAAVDNVSMLEFLSARGAEVRADGGGALVDAAAHGSINALDWLLAHGAEVHAAGDAALAAAAGSLSMEAVDILLDAGADIHAGSELALCHAFSARPYHLFAGEGQDFVHLRVDMVLRLIERGATPGHPAAVAAAEEAADVATLVFEQLKKHRPAAEAPRGAGLQDG